MQKLHPVFKSTHVNEAIVSLVISGITFLSVVFYKLVKISKFYKYAISYKDDIELFRVFIKHPSYNHMLVKISNYPLLSF